MIDNKTILITGGTGSFGKKFARTILEKHKPKKVIIFSRDEMKQYEMQKEFDYPNLRFFIGDVRDVNRLKRALDGVDIVIHAAALKIVPSAEYNPFEYINTNINGAVNIIDAAIDAGVKKVVALSTDKAVNPSNLYGATKLCSDKLFVAGNAYAGEHDTKFSVVRYGNVAGSRGSVIPFFKEKIQTGKLPVTDERMTRFWIELDQAVELVLLALEDAIGGEIYVKKIPSMNIMDLVKAFGVKVDVEFIGIRPGEKLHEAMITENDSEYTYEYDTYFKILPNIYDSHRNSARIKNGKKVPAGFVYSSDNNTDWLSVEQMRKIIENT